MAIHLISGPETAKEREAYNVGYSHGARFDHPFSPHYGYDSSERQAYTLGFDTAVDEKIDCKPNLEGTINE